MALAAAVAFTGCAATHVNSYLARQADITRYHTFALAAPGRFETGDPRLDNNPFFQDRAQAAIEKELAGRGFEKVPAGSAALIVHYYLSVKQQVTGNHAEAQYGSENQYGSCAGCTPPYVSDADTLVIDLVDARTEQLVWRGWVEGNAQGAIDDQRVMEQRIDKAIARILSKLPRLS
jgi:hypothetical protein